jgi:hypothetical protein
VAKRKGVILLNRFGKTSWLDTFLLTRTLSTEKSFIK